MLLEGNPVFKTGLYDPSFCCPVCVRVNETVCICVIFPSLTAVWKGVRLWFSYHDLIYHDSHCGFCIYCRLKNNCWNNLLFWFASSPPSCPPFHPFLSSSIRADRLFPPINLHPCFSNISPVFSFSPALHAHSLTLLLSSADRQQAGSSAVVIAVVVCVLLLLLLVAGLFFLNKKGKLSCGKKNKKDVWVAV